MGIFDEVILIILLASFVVHGLLYCLARSAAVDIRQVQVYIAVSRSLIDSLRMEVDLALDRIAKEQFEQELANLRRDNAVE